MSPYGLMIGKTSMCSSYAFFLPTMVIVHLLLSPLLCCLLAATSFSQDALMYTCHTDATSLCKNATALFCGVCCVPLLCLAVYSSIACVCQLSAEFRSSCASAAGFAIFAIVVMPMLKVDPNEYKELMGDKQAKEALPGGSSDSTPARPRLR